VTPGWHRETVRPDWIDYNGHLSEPYYVLVFGHATDALMDRVGLDAAYRSATGCSLYTVEAHVRYLREVPDGSELAVRTRVLQVDAKRVHFAHEMFVGDTLVATEELLAVHVDAEAGRASPLPEASRDALTELVEAPPEYTGRHITLRQGIDDATPAR
jgi:acyl-CoA thioester hydrolase